MKSSVLLIIGIFVLVGCTASETIIDEPVSESVLKYDFVVEQNYLAAYQKILKRGRECIKPGLTAQMVVEGSVFNESQVADVTVVLYGIFSRYPHLLIKIEAIEKNRSKVSVSNTLPRWNAYAKAVNTWVDDKTSSCTTTD